MVYKSIDLFAGIGGIRLGFDRAFKDEIETVFVSEWDEKAQETYRANFDDDFEIAGDITKIDESQIPEFDICLAGFPCQAFSMAGRKQGFDDDYKGTCRGTLFLDVARICDYHKPKVIFCENVKGLTIHDRGRTYKIIKKTFEDLGYTVFDKILNSRNFGVPQNRERIYLVAFRNDIAPKNFIFPESTDSSKVLWDIREEEAVPAKYYLSSKYMDTLIAHKKRHESKGNGFGYEIRDWDDVAGAIVCGGMGRERNLVTDSRQKKLIPTTNIKGEINPYGIRKMTPCEWARLQGYPDDFVLPLADTHLYKQLGNSVTVPVITAIAKKIKKVLEMADGTYKPDLSGNKGEWSEIYVFFRLLEIGKLYAADANLNKMDDVFYNIIKILRQENIGKLEFRVNRDENTITIINTTDESVLGTMPVTEFKAAADKLYSEITKSQSNTKGAFSLRDTEAFLDNLGVSSLKAPSEDKADIRIKIHDINTGFESIQGFSIKSRLGGPSTLINAGKTTNFIFEVNGPINDEIMNQFNTCSKKFKDKFTVLQNSACDIEYIGMENSVFEGNLMLIDGDLPKICGYMLKSYYSSGLNKVIDSLNRITETNPLNYNLSNGHPFYSYKFKRMLSECALGMLPGKTWDGIADATGGYIIVREDGEVLCYHLFNHNEFENYLLQNTKFETASTGRHQFGTIYKENDKYFLKLNLQIRFIK